MSQDITTLGLAVDSTEVKGATTDLDKMTEAGNKAADAATKLGESSDFAEKRAAILARHAEILAKNANESAEAMSRGATATDKASEATGGFSMSTASAVAVGTVLGEVLLRMGGAMIDWVGQALKAAQATHEMSARLGVAAEDLAGLNAAFVTSGVGASGMQMAMSQLQRAAVADSEALQRLGVDVKNSSGEFKTSKELLYEVAERFDGTRDSAEKSALAVQLFGRSAAQLMPLLNEGAVGLKDMAEVAEKLGLVIDTETAEAGNKLDGVLTLLNLSLQAVVTRIFSNVLPALASMADEFMRSDTLAVALTGTSKLLGAGLDLLVTFVDGVVTAFTTLVRVIYGVNVAAYQFFTGEWKQSASTLIEMVEGIGASWERSGARINNTFDNSNAKTSEASKRTLELSDATKKANAENAKYLLGLEEQNMIMALTIENGGKLSRAQTLEAKLNFELANSTKVMTDAQLDAALAAINEAGALDKANDAIKSAAKSAKDSEKAHAAYSKQQAAVTNSLNDFIDKAMEGIAAQSKLNGHVFKATSYDDQYAKALKGLAGEFIKTNKLQKEQGDNMRIALFALAELTAETQQAIAVDAEAARWKEEVNKWLRKQSDEQDKLTATMQTALMRDIAANDALKQQAERLGMTAEQIRQVERATAAREVAVMRSTATDMEWQAANEGGNRTLEEQARLLRARAEQAEKGTLLKEAIDVGKEWAKTVEDIGRGLTDSLFRAFESGKGFFDTLWDGIKNVFKTTVLKILIQPVQNGITSIVGSLLGGVGSAAGAATGATDSGIGSMIGSAAGSLFGSFTGGGSILGFAGDVFGSAIGAGTSGVGALSGLAGSIGTAIAAIPVWGWIAAGLLAIASSFDKSGTPHLGGTVTADSSGARQVSGDIMGWHNQQVATETVDALKLLSGGLVGTLNALSGSFGGTNNFRVNAGFAADNTDPSWGYLGIMRGQQAVGGWSGDGSSGVWNRKDFAVDAETGYKQFLEQVALSTRTAIDSIGLPEWAQATLDALGGAPTLEQLADAVNDIITAQAVIESFGAAVAPLGGVFAQVATLSGDATLQLAGFAGGMDALISKTQAFVATYYSEAEKASLQAASIKAALESAGLATNITTKDQFRFMVDSLDVNTEIGRKQLATLLDIAPTFAALAETLFATGQSIAELASGAPQSAALEQSTAQTNAVVEVSESVMTIGEQITDAVHKLQESTEAGLAAIAAATQATVSKLESWDDGGAMLTTAA